ncbi:MAG: Ig-like domain-containing protein, partial [Hominilimicola sp.]
LYVGNSRTLDSSDTAWKTNGDYFTLNADVLTDNYGENDIEWSVSDEEIIKIKSSNDGTADVQALRTGFADVYASLPDGGKAVCRICVIDNYCRLTVQKIEFNIDNLTLAINDAAQVKPILYPKSVYDNGILDKTLSWSSSDASVAEVSSDGTVTAKSAGKAIITAVSADVERKASFNVTVKDSIGATGITADNAEIKNVKVGETVQLSASADSDIIWKSENSFVADVDENGLVTAYSNSNKQVVTSDGAKVTEEADTVKIYATTAEGGYIAEFDLCISDADVDVQSVDIDAENIALAAGTTKNITAVIAPANILEQSVTWTSDNESIVTVEKTDNTIYGANQAVLTAVGSGTAHITASYGGKSDKCTVTVTESTVKAHSVSVKTSKEIDIDEVYQLTASVDENVTNKEIIWLGTNADIATVDREGNVMGYSAGTIKIYAIAADSLTEDEVTQLKSLRHDKRVIEESDIRDIIDGAIYSVCELTVKDSSPYLRNLHAPDEAITDCSVNLLWNRASLLQAADFKEYRVYQDDELIAVTDNLGYTVDNLSPSAEYSFRVTAVDNAYNEIISETLKVTTAEKSTVINVLDYGARGDGTTLDTYAIQSAINACPKGGTVWLPDGVYYSGALFLKSDMKFKIDGILIGSIDPKDYPHIISKWEGWRKLPQTADEWDNSETGSDKYLEENEYAHSSLINIGVYHEGENSVTGPYSAENIIICGNGQINGNGFALAYNEGPNHKKRENNTSYFKADAPVTDPTTRGKTILLHNAQNVYIKDILVSYSPSWTVHAIYCDNVTFDNMKVISQGRGNVGEGSTVKLAGHLFNGDGIDPESCTNINIFNTYFRTGDDSVTLKSGRNREGNELDKPNAYVRITDCETNFSLGGFGTGSENAGGAHDILYQNLKADTMAIYGMWFKTNEARGGLTENIQIRDVDLKNANTAICINHTYSSSTNNPAAEKPVLRNVTIENANGSGVSKAYNFEGLSSSKIENITIFGGTITDFSGSSVKYGKKFDIRNVGGTTWSWSNSEDITVYIERIETDTKINILDEIAIKKVDNDNKTVTVYKGATGQNLLDGVSSQEGGKQTYSLSSDSLAELAGNETLTVTSPDGSCIENYTVIVSDEAMDTSSYIIAENFTSTTGDWGFTGTGKAAVEDDGTLSLLSDKKNNT